MDIYRTLSQINSIQISNLTRSTDNNSGVIDGIFIFTTSIIAIGIIVIIRLFYTQKKRGKTMNLSRKPSER
ncbi:MAG: hypothetical protein ACTSWY_13900 [Promethearchaeota archaeon]